MYVNPPSVPAFAELSLRSAGIVHPLVWLPLVEGEMEGPRDGREGGGPRGPRLEVDAGDPGGLLGGGPGGCRGFIGGGPEGVFGGWGIMEIL